MAGSFPEATLAASGVGFIPVVASFSAACRSASSISSGVNPFFDKKSRLLEESAPTTFSCVKNETPFAIKEGRKDDDGADDEGGMSSFASEEEEEDIYRQMNVPHFEVVCE